MDSITIGKNLKELRGNMTLKEVASATNLTVAAISNYENGIRIPQDDIKIRIANFYNVTVGSLFFGEKLNK